MKYKIGDKVKIREDLVPDTTYGVDRFVADMERYCGCEAIITDILAWRGEYSLNVNGVDIDWCWTDEMFEELEEEHTSKFNVGDKVRVKKDLEVYKKYNGLTLTRDMYECHHGIMTIESADNDCYTCTESCYFWGEDMLEKVEEVNDNEQVRTVDVGFHLDYCGHKVLENVWQGGNATECKERSVFFTSYDCKNQYTLPLSAIDFVIPHED